MAVIRSLMILGFLGSAIGGWFINRIKQTRTRQKRQEPDFVLDTPESIAIALKHRRWQIRLSAVKLLQNKHNDQTLESLVGMLGDPVIEVREAASSGIIEYRQDAISTLAEVLITGELLAREMAAQTISAIGTKQAVSVLAKALSDDESAWVRIPAALGLGHIGGREATSALKNALADPHPDVVAAVRKALNIGASGAIHNEAYKHDVTR